VSAAETFVLVLAGIGAGLTGTIAGLASIVSYPAVLAVGLTATTANITNTVAMIGVTVGSMAGSQPELRGQWGGTGRLFVAGIVGGLCGAALLLALPEGSFERVVPVLVFGASVAILVGPRAGARAAARPLAAAGPGVLAAVGLVSVYGGFFGAGAGTMLLALLLHASSDSLPRVNAVKTVILGSANSVAAVVFVARGDVVWSAALPLAAGLLVGGRLGPAVVRWAPVGPLRAVMALAGLLLAVRLAADAFW
jgi:hypothetical protein